MSAVSGSAASAPRHSVAESEPCDRRPQSAHASDGATASATQLEQFEDLRHQALLREVSELHARSAGSGPQLNVLNQALSGWWSNAADLAVARSDPAPLSDSSDSEDLSRRAAKHEALAETLMAQRDAAAELLRRVADRHTDLAHRLHCVRSSKSADGLSTPRPEQSRARPSLTPPPPRGVEAGPAEAAEWADVRLPSPRRSRASALLSPRKRARAELRLRRRAAARARERAAAAAAAADVDCGSSAGRRPSASSAPRESRAPSLSSPVVKQPSVGFAAPQQPAARPPTAPSQGLPPPASHPPAGQPPGIPPPAGAPPPAGPPPAGSRRSSAATAAASTPHGPRGHWVQTDDAPARVEVGTGTAEQTVVDCERGLEGLCRAVMAKRERKQSELAGVEQRLWAAEEEAAQLAARVAELAGRKAMTLEAVVQQRETLRTSLASYEAQREEELSQLPLDSDAAAKAAGRWDTLISVTAAECAAVAESLRHVTERADACAADAVAARDRIQQHQSGLREERDALRRQVDELSRREAALSTLSASSPARVR
eukprot:TRINITY_DN7226_c0_g1_i1.p1 TRINITY_DN7226_c0_g1~~TRINITY_DN7226_c0_g1_i1.p1  ORF type:complete len:558 (+),score=230.19 TRINITY_DN7226_c0_g1_i1:39-1676(+)